MPIAKRTKFKVKLINYKGQVLTHFTGRLPGFFRDPKITAQDALTEYLKDELDICCDTTTFNSFNQLEGGVWQSTVKDVGLTSCPESYRWH